MRLGTVALALAALPSVLGGCAGGTATPAVSATPATAATPWLVVATGSVTPTPVPSTSVSYRHGLPAVSFLATSSGCAVGWPQSGLVLIPMIVTPLKGALKVQWSADYGSVYRLTAVDQRLVAGPQPTPSWQTVHAGTGCPGTMTATITGLTTGVPYIVWLDAPNPPRGLDGTSGLRSGKSGIVIPL
jgi:hypothetical protein